ncbi:Pyridoxal 5'-phosphate synthase subunit snz1 [Coemansia erecta]|nr:Pyridoxal 5'-phosphate synthase subunit snz1 [Coemansia sp. RSA 2618]KAJ2822365.1 Pyridoxal 5'-phosphate synthase subunit snz1 [Coemansia erecta]
MVPVVGRIRVGHMTESLLMETCGVDVIDEHESMTSSGGNPVDKYGKTPHIAAVKNLETALDAICKGASMLRTECPKDENKPKTLKDTSEMIKTIFKDIKVYSDMTPEALKTKLDTLTPSKASLIRQCVRHKRLPVPLFADGGVVLPLDAALMMHFGADGVVASAQVFKAKNPENRIRAMVMAVTHFNDPYKLSRYSEGNGIAGPELKYE